MENLVNKLLNEAVSILNEGNCEYSVNSEVKHPIKNAELSQVTSLASGETLPKLTITFTDSDTPAKYTSVMTIFNMLKFVEIKGDEENGN